MLRVTTNAALHDRTPRESWSLASIQAAQSRSLQAGSSVALRKAFAYSLVHVAQSQGVLFVTTSPVDPTRLKKTAGAVFLAALDGALPLDIRQLESRMQKSPPAGPLCRPGRAGGSNVRPVRLQGSWRWLSF